jgi:hypothetical protein
MKVVRELVFDDKRIKITLERAGGDNPFVSPVPKKVYYEANKVVDLSNFVVIKDRFNKKGENLQEEEAEAIRAATEEHILVIEKVRSSGINPELLARGGYVFVPLETYNEILPVMRENYPGKEEWEIHNLMVEAWKAMEKMEERNGL